ncbi:MAG: hypothetical protein DSY76_07405, partial [Bacteroidetes bacterium]
MLDTDKDLIIELNNYDQTLYYNLDITTFDITHTQRLIGTINNKYNNFETYELNIGSYLRHKKYYTVEQQDVLNHSIIMHKKINTIKKSFYKEEVILNIDNYLKDYNKFDIQDLEDIVVYNNISRDALSIYSSIPKEIKDISVAICQKGPHQFLEKILGITFQKITTRYSKFLDPLQPEQHASVSLLHDTNTGVLLISDYHKNKIYNFLEYIVLVKKERDKNTSYTISDAITDILSIDSS